MSRRCAAVGRWFERAPLFCLLCRSQVWQGVVKQRAFKGGFKTETIPDATLAKALLDSLGIGHYWDAAATFNPDEALPIKLD